MNQIQRHFNKLYDCVVRKLHYDYLGARFDLVLENVENGVYHNVIFENVDTCLLTMMGVEGEICKNIYPELSSILLTSINILTTSKWLAEYPLKYNICIEIVDRAILLNAHSIKIDSEVYSEPFD